MNWLIFLNKSFGLVTLLLFTVAGACAFLSSTAADRNLRRPKPLATTLPNRFALTKEAYDAINSPPLALRYVPPAIQLPDLRDELIYYGTDGRPDADPDNPIVHLGLRGRDTVYAVPAGNPWFLSFKRSGGSGSYQPSLNQVETNLWVQVFPSDAGQVKVGVTMRSGDDRLITSPEAHTDFTLKAHNGGRPLLGSWHLGSHRVDSGLLARLRARWHGKDLFLANHGGDEFAHARGKERIDFGEGKTLYSRFVAEGDTLIWKGGQWEAVAPQVSSRGYPLLHVLKADEKLMHCEVWDEEGKFRMPLSLMRARTTWMPEHFRNMLRFVAAKTWSQFVLLAGQERLVVSPDDWLLLSNGQWQELATVEQIDDYVAGRLTGELLVLEGLARRDGTQMLSATLYNGARTAAQALEIPLTPQSGPIATEHQYTERMAAEEQLVGSEPEVFE